MLTSMKQQRPPKSKSKTKPDAPGLDSETWVGAPTPPTEDITSPSPVSPAALPALAQHMEAQLNLIQRRMRQSLQAEFARGQLTGPQRLVMHALIQSKALSLKQLSEAVSLAHSTVSGIVDRLEKQGFLERQSDPTDRRITRLIPSNAVREFLAVRMPELAVHPLLEALRTATPAQRQTIATGLNTLAHLLDDATPKDPKTPPEIPIETLLVP
jgi:DNA-binding MarR family transcriptional regulator